MNNQIGLARSSSFPCLDLVAELEWEESEEIEFLSLEEAGFEEEWETPFDLVSPVDYVNWWSDGEDSRYESC